MKCNKCFINILFIPFEIHFKITNLMQSFNMVHSESSELKNESQTDSDTLPVICCVNRILIFITIEFCCMISLKLTFQCDNRTIGWPFIWSIMCLLTVLDSIKTGYFMGQFTEIFVFSVHFCLHNAHLYFLEFLQAIFFFS